MPGQRLLAELDLFADTQVVLSDPKYWNPDFARHFIEAWDGVAYVDPHAGIRLAATAIALVELLDEEARPILRPRALSTLGSSHRALEEPQEAEDVFERVQALHDGILVPRLDEADYCRRMTYLRMEQGRFEEALTFCERTIVLCRAEQADHELGRACSARGAVYLSMVLRALEVPAGEPIASLSEALRRVDPRLGMHTYEAPMGNLAVALLEGYPGDLALALRTLTEAAHIHARHRVSKKTLPNALLRWVIGLVYLRIGPLHKAGEVLCRARRVLMRLGYPRKVVCISLDLARVYAALGQWGRLRILVEEIMTLDGLYAPEGLVALHAWYRAIRRESVPDHLWHRVLETIRWPLAPPKERQGQPVSFPRLPKDRPWW